MAESHRAEDSSPSLSSFIRTRRDDIIQSWQQTLRKLPVASGLSQAALLDHFPQLLERVAEMIDTMAAGNVPYMPPEDAEKHAIHRLEAGFDLAQVVTEYAVLRDIILRLWSAEQPSTADLDSVRVVNSAIDIAVSTSLERYTAAHVRTLQALDRISVAASWEEGVEALLQRLLKVFQETTAAVDTAAILLLEGEELVVRAAAGLEESWKHRFAIKIGDGFAGTIALTREPLLLHSASTDPLVKNHEIRERGIRALYGVPLTDGSRLIGVAHMGSLKAEDFAEQDKLLFRTLAHRATVILHQALLREAAARRMMQQAAVVELGLFALSPRDVPAILNEAVQVVTRTLGTGLTGIFELLPDEERLRLVAGAGWKEGLVGSATIGLGRESQAGYTLQSGESVLVRDFCTETRFSGAPLLLEHGAVCGLSAIIPGQDGPPYGIISTHAQHYRPFHREDVDFLEGVANVVAAALARGRIEEALRRSEERFRLLVEGVEEQAICMLDPTGRISSWNLGAERINGYRAEEVIGRHFSCFFLPEEIQAGRPEQLLEEAQKAGRVAEEGWRVRKDGSRFWASVVITAIRDASGQLRGYSKVTRDVTERKRLMEEMERRNAELEAVIDSLPDGVVIGDSKGIRRTNRLALTLAGFSSPEDLKTDLWRPLGPAMLRDATTGQPLRFEDIPFARALNGETCEREVLIRHLETRQDRVLRAAAAPIRLRGELIGAVAVMTDVTERRRYEESQRLLVDASRTLVEAMDPERMFQQICDLIIRWKADACAIELLEPENRLRLVALSHRDPARVEMARRLRTRFPPGPDAPIGALHVARTGKPWLVPELSDELMVAHAQGAEHLSILRALELRSTIAVPLMARGRAFGAITVVSSDPGRRFDEFDTTVLSKLAANTALAYDNALLFAEAQEATRLREQLLAVVSHDLKNPLTALNLGASILARRLRLAPDRQLELKQVELILRNANRMEHLLTDLQDMVNIQTGRLRVERTNHTAGELVDEAIELLEPLARESGLTLKQEGDTVDVQIRCDRQRILQVFSNLIGNASKFAEPGGGITVRTELLEGEVLFSVHDTGPGIPAEELSHIFEPYWSARTHEHKGMGLGLYICRGIVEAHDGRIWVESEPGKGSTFFFTLPRL